MNLPWPSKTHSSALGNNFNLSTLPSFVDNGNSKTLPANLAQFIESNPQTSPFSPKSM